MSTAPLFSLGCISAMLTLLHRSHTQPTSESSRSENIGPSDYLFFLPKYRDVSPSGMSSNDSAVK